MVGTVKKCLVEIPASERDRIRCVPFLRNVQGELFSWTKIVPSLKSIHFFLYDPAAAVSESGDSSQPYDARFSHCMGFLSSHAFQSKPVFFLLFFFFSQGFIPMAWICWVLPPTSCVSNLMEMYSSCKMVVNNTK